MKLNLLVAPGIIACAFLLSANVASAQIADLLGEWHNIDSSTPGLTRVVITENGSEVALHTWGKCHPEDCDWGPVLGNVYGNTVRDNLISAAHAISAIVQTNFSETLLIVHLIGPNRLQVETMTRFTDGTGRSSYARVDTFSRVQP
jgi:hypothetical protein